jgi:ATP-dependent 26S proteasome regulatory subunit
VPDLSQCRDTVERFVKARIPFVSVRTAEHHRAVEMLRDVATTVQVPILVHTLSQGVRDLRDNRVVSDERSVVGALEYASQQVVQRQHFTMVLTDVQDVGADNVVTRQLLDVANLAAQRGGVIIVLGSTSVWPPLQRLGMSITLDTPTEDEMYEIVRVNIEPYRQQITIEWGEKEMRTASSILHGLTQVQAENGIASILAKGSVTTADVIELSRVKDQMFSDISGLERITLDPSLNAVGGLAGLRQWLDGQRQLLTADLRDRGMRPPRGVLLVGVPGCGKSLSAKTIAATWQLPLYRLDLANIQGMYVGQSEARLKDALDTADHVAPCVLWIDEIEKGLAGIGSDSTGVSTRLVGHFLFWLQESRHRVFVVATANDVSKLPPELLRRGRFDELFFVDLPNEDERREIISIFVARNLKTTLPEGLMDRLVELSGGFAGSDLEAAVYEVAKIAVLHGDDAVDEETILASFRNVVPLSRTSPEQIEWIRSWGRERAVPASGRPIADPESGAGRTVLV